MDIAVAADWATVIAVVGALIGGVWWWGWRRPRHNKRVKQAIDIMDGWDKARKAVDDFTFGEMASNETSDAEKVMRIYSR